MLAIATQTINDYTDSIASKGLSAISTVTAGLRNGSKLIHSESTHGPSALSGGYSAPRSKGGGFHPASRAAARGPFAANAGHLGHSESL